MDLCARIRSARVRAGISQQELADSLGVSRGAVANWESNAKAVPRVENLRGIAARLGVSISWLVTGRDSGGELLARKARDDATATEHIDPRQMYAQWQNEIARNMRTVMDLVPEPLMLSASHDNVHGIDPARRVLHVNRAFREKLGYDTGEIPVLQVMFERFFPDQAYRVEIEAHWAGTLQGSAEQGLPTASARYLIHCGDGHYRWFDLRTNLDNPTLPGFRLCAYIERHEFLHAHKHPGMHGQIDPVTQLPGRWIGERELERLLLMRLEGGASLCLMLCDIDKLRQVNADFGRDGGNKLLRQVADAIRGSVRSHDVLARWDGDEFLLAFSDLEETDAMRLAERIRTSVRELQFDLHGIRTATSIGIGAVLAHDETSVAELIAAANAAVYGAKRRGRDCQHFMRDKKTTHAALAPAV